jgi:hypothetical protein
MIALVILEVAVVGAVGMLALASATLGRAERLERAAALAEGVLDSLAGARVPADGHAAYGTGEVAWTVGAGGAVTLRALGPAGDTLFAVTSVLPARGSR